MLLIRHALGIDRFVRYMVVGVGTFLVDLGLLFFFIDTLFIPPARAAGLSFIIALTLNYALSRRYVFGESQRSATSTYVVFIILGILGVVIVTTLMYVATTILAWNYLASRVCIAGIVGILNYLLNLFVNFRVAGVATRQKN